MTESQAPERYAIAPFVAVPYIGGPLDGSNGGFASMQEGVRLTGCMWMPSSGVTPFEYEYRNGQLIYVPTAA